jgi:N-acetylglucosamine kinase-like BadF-type ATPase
MSRPNGQPDLAERAAVLAVDGGNSKTEVVLLDRRGAVLGVARGAGTNHSHSDHRSVMTLIDSLVAQAAARWRSSCPAEAATTAIAEVGVLSLAGSDFSYDDRRLVAAASPFGWADRLVVCNDALAILEAGTDSVAGVAVVCGAGTNCFGRAADGRTVRFPALGPISGDWGGGYDIGLSAVSAAVRAQDGRGPRTSLADVVPRYFGVAKPSALVFAIHTGRIDEHRMVELPAVVFAAADDGDGVAAAIVERQADELVAMAGAALRRLRLTRSAVDVVLGGGVLTSGYRPLVDRVVEGIGAIAPRARPVELDAAPVTGAALMGLSELQLTPAADVRLAVNEALHHEEWR